MATKLNGEEKKKYYFLKTPLRSIKQLEQGNHIYSHYKYAICPRCKNKTSTEYVCCRTCLFNVSRYFEPRTIQAIMYTRTAEERIYDDFSPEEVMAGVPHGGILKESGLKGESTKNWSEEQAEQVKWAEENLA